MMTKKDFISLADHLRRIQCIPADVKLAIDNFCRNQNPSFKSGRFWGYIAGENGPSGGAVKKGQFDAR